MLRKLFVNALNNHGSNAPGCASSVAAQAELKSGRKAESCTTRLRHLHAANSHLLAQFHPHLGHEHVAGSLLHGVDLVVREISKQHSTLA